ncbi:MAG: AI-2E family transporter, partial [Rhodospirillales bacterium]|nr:AI-2E family transporter [Rhodospirillales bacterium]
MSDLPEAAPETASPPELPRIASLLGAILALLAVAALVLAREVLIPITLAILLSFLLAPLTRVLRALRLGRALSAILAVLLGLAVLAGLGWLIGAQIAGLAGQLPRYQATVEAKLDATRDLVTADLAAISARLGFAPPVVPLAPPPAKPPVVSVPAPPKPAPPAPATVISPHIDQAFRMAKTVLLPVASPLGTAGIVFGIAVFILLQREDLRERLIAVFGTEDPQRATLALDEVGERLSQYYLALLGVNAVFGIAIALGLWAIGVPSPVLWGTLAMLLRFVPYIGTPLAVLLPLALSVAVSPGWGMALATIALFGGLELLVSQAVEPFLYGNRTGLSPFAVVVAAVFWTWAWGTIGLLLSTPLTVCLVVLGRSVPALRFLETLLGGRLEGASLPEFDRALRAADADALEDLATRALTTMTLQDYYGTVAMPALRRAAED